MIHLNVTAYGFDLDLEGRLRGRVEANLYCDACKCHVDWPIDTSPVSVPVADIEATAAAHEAERHR